MLGGWDERLHFGRRGGEQRLGEPGPLAGQLTDDVQRLMALLRLQAVDRQDQRRGPLVVPAQGFGVLLAGREHRLVAADVICDAPFGDGDGEALRHVSPGPRGLPRVRESAPTASPRYEAQTA